MMNNVNHTMIVLARQSRGLTQTELASRLHCQQGTISKIEQGDLGVSSEMLEALSREDVLDYPVEFFMQNGEIYPPGLKYNRVRKSLSRRVLEQIDALNNIRAMQLSHLLKRGEYDVQVPFLSVEQLGSPENVARAMREVWGVPRGPIKNLTHLLEDEGIVIIQQDFQTDKWDGVYIRFPHLPPILFINGLMTGDRMRYTKAHEAGHVILHRIPKDPAVMEEEANRFAAEFLMPEEDIRPYLKNVGLPELANLKRRWGVAMQALLVRARTLGMISERRSKNLWRQISREGWRKREPVELDIPIEKPTLRDELVELHLKEFRFPAREIQELVMLNDGDFRRDYIPSTPHLRLVMQG